MYNKFNDWVSERLIKPEVAVLLLVIIAGIIIIVFFGELFAPILAGIVIAFLLESVVRFLVDYIKIPRYLSVVITFVAFCAIFVIAVIFLLPALLRQLSEIIEHFPDMLNQFHLILDRLPQEYPKVFTYDFVNDLKQSTKISPDKLPQVGKYVWTYSLASIPSIITWIVYLVLVPLLTLYFLKDKSSLMNWISSIMPERRRLLNEVSSEMQFQLGRFVRGKFLELLIVWISSYVGFVIFGLNYAFLLSFAVGVSTIIPYIGMVLVTIPVIFIGLFQWGLEPQFMYMFLVYLIVQGLDGTVLVPILFSGAVNLHPIAIIAAVLFFGGIWGFWGLFFSIPLATLVRAVCSAWYRHYQE
jgi:putative permease